MFFRFVSSIALGAALSVAVAPRSAAAQVPPQATSELSAAPSLPLRLRLVDGGHLPLSFAHSLLARAELAFHHDDSLAYAYYEPPRPVSRRDRAADGGGIEGGIEGRRVELGPPRLALQRRYFSSAEVAFPELTIDLAENLAFALLLGHLHDQVEQRTGYGVLLRERALASRSEGEAEDDAVAAWMMAVASYGSHLLSLANEVERVSRRIEARGGKDLCQLIAGRVGLLGLWERAFGVPFAGSAFDSSGSEVVRYVPDEDQRSLVEKVFEGAWKGDAMADFGARYCRR